MSKKIRLYHRGEEMNIEQFIERNFIFNITSKELFDENKKEIFDQLTDSDKVKIKEKGGKYPESENDITIDTILPNPCSLLVDPEKVTAEVAINQTNYQVETDDFYAFAEEKIQEMYQDEGYKISSTTKKAPTCSVFGWFKSLYFLKQVNGKRWRDESKVAKELADLSHYIISLATNVTENGGSFSFRLPALNAPKALSNIYWNGEDENRIWGSPEKDISRYGSEGHFYDKSIFAQTESNYFNWLISSNDLIFISFEKLDMELFRRKENGLSDNDDRFDFREAINEGVFDMIGLIDDVKVVTNAANSEAYVEVTGRDLMKLLIEDGSFFFNPSTTSDPSSVFINESSGAKQGDIKDANQLNNTYNNPINRLRNVTDELDIFANKINMDIGYILKGVISQLANVEVVPNYVFEPWGSDRTKFIELMPKDKKK